jgi:Glucosidase II beta subunit-like protein
MRLLHVQVVVSCCCLLPPLLVIATDIPLYEHTKLFPPNDEYDSKILDPNTIYGSPFGGFSRATRSRLAALPLRLPDVAILEENSNVDSLSYFETSDVMGRGYICRVYHEDALDEYTLGDSLFDTPVLATEGSRQKKEERDEDLSPLDLYDDDDDFSNEEEDKQHNNDLRLMETSRRLSNLEGVCSQIHLGWWSYEWCYDQSVTQFHIHVETGSSGLELRDVTSLGKFEKRKFTVDLSVDNPQLLPAVNKYAEDEPELSRVTDTYSGGDVCDATGKPRATQVQYFCCSDRVMAKYRGPVLRHGNPMNSKIVSIVSLLEDPQEVCTYTITVCTPLLCEEVKSDDDDGLLFDINSESLLPSRSKSSKAPSTSVHRRTHKVGEDETIRDILDRVVGKHCIHSSTSGWWSYEYCHRKHVRQYHESINIQLDTGKTTGSEDVYMLGYYNEDLDSYPDEEEYKYVVNTTLTPSGTASETITEGNKEGAITVAAYFTAEYTGGEVCDDSDVTDSAVKAGGVNSHIIERSSSVRYSCGSSFDIYVKEDHTCHYIVEVTVPALCDHPLFKAPVAKKRVVKCIPVQETSEWEDNQSETNEPDGN